ncbi:MAG: hypothetical protein ACYDG2_25245 [Ruminiclostridium sp.]
MEEKKKRPAWYYETVKRLYQYPLDKKRLAVLNARLETEMPSATAQYSLAPAYTGPGDQTGNIVSKRWETSEEINELRIKIREIEIASNGFGVDEKRIIDLRYFQRHNKDWWVARQVDIPLRTYYRIRDELVAEIAVSLGIIKRDQISFEEMGWLV